MDDYGKIYYVDTDGVKGDLPIYTLGIDSYPASPDYMKLFLGIGGGNYRALADVRDLVADKISTDPTVTGLSLTSTNVEKALVELNKLNKWGDLT